ncbi:MAG: CapA family protein [Chloroflexi bacterium]|nr:CapA family protein [Chloroflexota bacterium]
MFFLFILVACQPIPRTVTLAFLGDLMLGRGVTPDEDSLAYLAPYLQSADLALANLESPLTTAPSQTSGYNLCAPPERVLFLVAAGLDLLSVANNHSLDCGPDGLAEAESTLHASGLTPLGPQPIYRTINGLRLAFLAFDDVSAPLDAAAAAQIIRTAHDSGALVIVSIHWGVEYQGGASERQKWLAAQFAQAGAALIWGHHPHVIQPAEWVQPPAGSTHSSPPQSKPAGGSTLVLYSLGNALFDQVGLADTRQSALVLVDLDENGVRSAHAIPFEIDVQHSRVQAADDRVAQAILERVGLK